MNELPYSKLRNTVFRLNTNTGFGTGFFVGNQLILTCKHIAENLTEQVSEEIGIVDIYYPSSSQLDIALIKTEKPNNICVWLDGNVSIGDKCYSYVFTDEYPKGDSLTLEYEGEYSDGFTGMKFKLGQVRPGSSGGPIMNFRTGAVCGMIIKTRGRVSDIGGRGVSSTEILECFHDIRVEQINYHSSQKTWRLLLNDQQRRIFDSSFFSELGLKTLVKNFLLFIKDYSKSPIENINAINQYYENVISYANVIYSNIENADFVHSLEDIIKRTYTETSEVINIIEQIEKNLHITIPVKAISDIEMKQYPCSYPLVNFLFDIISVKNSIIYDIKPLKINVIKNLNDMKHYLHSHYITGSKNIKRFELNKYTGLLIKFKWLFLDNRSENNTIKDELSVHIINSFCIGIPQSYLVLADPGIGKSTFINILYDHMLENRILNKLKYTPVYIDLKKYNIDSDFGTEVWLYNYLKVMEIDISQIVFIIDSLDEYIAGLTLAQINVFLNRKIFDYNCVIACRKQSYDRYLSQSEFSSRFEKALLMLWSEKMINRYISSYIRHLKLKPSVVKSIKNKINDSEYLKEVVAIPLRLNMLLDLMITNIGLSDNIDNLLSLYNVYINNWLKRESMRTGNILSLEKKRDYLKYIAWYFYDEAILGSNSRYASFTRYEMNNLLENIVEEECSSRIIDDLIERTLLLEEELPNFVNPITIKFIHKSFQEYFVANYLFDVMMDDPLKIAEDFQKFISPEVSEFLKECIYRLNPNKINIIVYKLIQAYKISIEKKNPRSRIARQQIAYYLGNIHDIVASSFLIECINSEEDLWIKRGMIIGLSFGGYHCYLDHYIELLSRERKEQSAELCVENHVNIGFTLSFFGDQPFNVMEPDRDLNISSCKNSMEHLLYQLGTDTDMGSWRLNLYTLLDFYKYRKNAEEEISAFFCKNRLKIERILNKIKSNKACFKWPEIDELSNVIKSFK